MNQHATTEQILEYVDGSSESEIVRGHIRGCSECSSRVQEFRQMDHAIKQLPLLKPGPDLTGKVMERVLEPPPDFLSYRLLKMLAYAAPMTIVLVILGAVFSLTGVIDLQGGDTTGARFQGLVETVAQVSQRASSVIVELLRDYAPFMANGESVGITFAILVILTMFAFVDRVIGPRMGGRAR